MALTPEQEAEARYPYETPQVKIQIYSGDYQKVLQTVFVEGAKWRDEQYKKDKERIEELEEEVTNLHARFLPCDYPKCGCIRGQYKCV